ncbi:MAG: ATP-binding protein [Anaerolineaceae bacterium]|nr:ATP-binding protein [Anaerolineaceae bacterium]MDD4043055.1 ATP-binding protein [Anaerolineaceae bacterium]MDD4576929.1 ATP-binding protein [Anaerolineaceae bacterium]
MKKVKEISTNLGNSISNKSETTPEGELTSQPDRISYGPGDPDCPICHGIGFVGYDVPMDDPRFGKSEICVCRLNTIQSLQQQNLFQLSNLGSLADLTFANFMPRGRVGLGLAQANSLEQAFNSAQNFAGTQKGWLLLTGGFGSGKTHLAAAIANQAVAMGTPAVFLTVPDLLDWLRSSFSTSGASSYEDRFTEIRNAALLVMDDFGTQSSTPWAEEKLFQIINSRYINHLPTVITSNHQLSEFEGRIHSRLLDPDLVTHVHILAPDFRNPTDEFGHPELSSLHLHSRQTFGNFSFRKDEGLRKEDVNSLREAFQAAQAFAENPKGWLSLHGTYGSGKTHLAAAVGNYQAAKGAPPLFIVVPDLLDHLRAAFAPNSGINLDKRFNEVRTAQLLILDDLGTQSATPWAREKLYQLFNYRYNAELPTVITSSALPDELDQRLFSRMSDRRLCKIQIITAAGYTGK